MKFIKRCVPVYCLALLMPAALLAQATGSVRGQVTDPSGAAIPNASVTLTGPNNAVKVAQTDDSGNYTVVGLASGQYMVRVMAPGFTLFEKPGLDIAAGRANNLDIPLSVEISKQEVTVADTQQIAIDPDKNAGALVIKGDDLDILPDDPDDLQADLLALAGPAAGPNGGQIFVDGFSNGQLPPKDSIREIRINSNPFSAEYDQSGYGRVEIFTKAGTDKTHGSVQMNYGDSIWNSRYPYSQNKPYYNTQNLNANLSGSLFKKLSLYMDFERRANKNSNSITAQLVDINTFAVSPYAPSIISPNTMYRYGPRFQLAIGPNYTLDVRYNYQGTSSSNNGVGGQNLLNTATTNTNKNQNVAATGTWVVTPAAINETRFQLQHNNSNSVGLFPDVNISVGDAFTTGASSPLNYSHNNTYEFQNYTSITHKTHFIKFGARIRGYLQDNFTQNNFNGQFSWQNVASYTNFLQGVSAGETLPMIFSAPITLSNGTRTCTSGISFCGGGPQYYTAANGNPLLGVNQVDAGLFIQDDWRIYPSVTLSLGLRYEIQNNIGDKNDWAPRIGLAWGIGPGQGRLKTPNTVLRLGYGWFYNRFSIGNVLNAERYNGTEQLSYNVPQPQFLSAAALQQIGYSAAVANALAIPIPSNLSQYAAQASQTYHIDPAYRSPVQMQTAVGVDRTLPKNMTLSVNYINTRGVHQQQIVDINTPLPGTFSPSLGKSSAVYPFGQAAGIYNLYESGGIFKQNQLIFNMRVPLGNKVSLQGYYAYGFANADSANPSNPYNFAQDWGRATYDIRHRIQVEGSVTLPFKIRLNPNISFQTAPPFNITQGIDEYGNTALNSRPAFAPSNFTGPICSYTVAQSGTTCLASGGIYGQFIVNPTPGMQVIPINYFRASAQFTVNMRLSRTWGFGERVNGNNTRQQQQQAQQQNNQPGFGRAAGGGGGGGNFRGGGGGGGGRGGGGGFPGGGGDSSGQKYTLTAGIVTRNLFNHLNPGAPQGDLLDNRFGEVLSTAGGNGGNQSANRRLEFNLRFSF